MTKDDATKAAQWLENQLLRPNLPKTFVDVLRARLRVHDVALANPLLKEVPAAYKAVKSNRAKLAALLKAQGTKT